MSFGAGTLGRGQWVDKGLKPIPGLAAAACVARFEPRRTPGTSRPPTRCRALRHSALITITAACALGWLQAWFKDARSAPVSAALNACSSVVRITTSSVVSRVKKSGLCSITQSPNIPPAPPVRLRQACAGRRARIARLLWRDISLSSINRHRYSARFHRALHVVRREIAVGAFKDLPASRIPQGSHGDDLPKYGCAASKPRLPRPEAR